MISKKILGATIAAGALFLTVPSVTTAFAKAAATHQPEWTETETLDMVDQADVPAPAMATAKSKLESIENVYLADDRCGKRVYEFIGKDRAGHRIALHVSDQGCTVKTMH